jgi:hypothetical protein
VIDAAAVPVIDGDMEALTVHATSLRTVGVDVADTGDRVHTTWQELRSVYVAPEGEELFAATLPIQQTAASVGEDIESVGTILIRYADEVRDIQTRLKNLSGQAAEFQADMNVVGDPRGDQAYVDRNNELVAAVNVAMADFDDAQRRCANAINALHRSTPGYRAPDDNGRIDPGEYGATTDQLDTAASGPGGVRWGGFELPAPAEDPRSFGDYAHDVLLVLGLVPGVGEPADGINAALYAAEGDYTGAGLSAAAMIPFGGWAASAGRLARTGSRTARAESDEVAQVVGILRDARRGKGNFGVGAATHAQSDAAGLAWVGERHTVASDGRTLVSADGLRQYRPPTFKPRLNTWQANLEERHVPSGAWQSNGHIDILE